MTRPRSVAISLVLVVVTLGVSACSQKDDTQSDLPRPSRAFCAAAGRYDAAVSSRKVSLTQHVRFTRAIAKSAPVDARREATIVWHSFEKLRAGDRSVVDNPRVKAAIEHVNRRAGQDCGWYRRKEGL
ncbi:MAG: hypothetical protein ABIP21_09415 [Acidimicrobiia bacterium]